MSQLPSHLKHQLKHASTIEKEKLEKKLEKIWQKADSIFLGFKNAARLSLKRTVYNITLNPDSFFSLIKSCQDILDVCKESECSISSFILNPQSQEQLNLIQDFKELIIQLSSLENKPITQCFDLGSMTFDRFFEITEQSSLPQPSYLHELKQNIEQSYFIIDKTLIKNLIHGINQKINLPFEMEFLKKLYQDIVHLEHLLLSFIDTLLEHHDSKESKKTLECLLYNQYQHLKGHYAHCEKIENQIVHFHSLVIDNYSNKHLLKPALLSTRAQRTAISNINLCVQELLNRPNAPIQYPYPELWDNIQKILNHYERYSNLLNQPSIAHQWDLEFFGDYFEYLNKNEFSSQALAKIAKGCLPLINIDPPILLTTKTSHPRFLEFIWALFKYNDPIHFFTFDAQPSDFTGKILKSTPADSKSAHIITEKQNDQKNKYVEFCNQVKSGAFTSEEILQLIHYYTRDFKIKNQHEKNNTLAFIKGLIQSDSALNYLAHPNLDNKISQQIQVFLVSLEKTKVNQTFISEMHQEIEKHQKKWVDPPSSQETPLEKLSFDSPSIQPVQDFIRALSFNDHDHDSMETQVERFTQAIEKGFNSLFLQLNLSELCVYFETNRVMQGLSIQNWIYFSKGLERLVVEILAGKISSSGSLHSNTSVRQFHYKVHFFKACFHTLLEKHQINNAYPIYKALCSPCLQHLKFPHDFSTHELENQMSMALAQWNPTDLKSSLPDLNATINELSDIQAHYVSPVLRAYHVGKRVEDIEHHQSILRQSHLPDEFDLVAYVRLNSHRDPLSHSTLAFNPKLPALLGLMYPQNKWEKNIERLTLSFRPPRVDLGQLNNLKQLLEKLEHFVFTEDGFDFLSPTSYQQVHHFITQAIEQSDPLPSLFTSLDCLLLCTQISQNLGTPINFEYHLASMLNIYFKRFEDTIESPSVKEIYEMHRFFLELSKEQLLQKRLEKGAHFWNFGEFLVFRQLNKLNTLKKELDEQYSQPSITSTSSSIENTLLATQQGILNRARTHKMTQAYTIERLNRLLEGDDANPYEHLSPDKIPYTSEHLKKMLTDNFACFAKSIDNPYQFVLEHPLVPFNSLGTKTPAPLSLQKVVLDYILVSIDAIGKLSGPDGQLALENEHHIHNILFGLNRINDNLNFLELPEHETEPTKLGSRIKSFVKDVVRRRKIIQRENLKMDQALKHSIYGIAFNVDLHEFLLGNEQLLHQYLHVSTHQNQTWQSVLIPSGLISTSEQDLDPTRKELTPYSDVNFDESAPELIQEGTHFTQN